MQQEPLSHHAKSQSTPPTAHSVASSETRQNRIRNPSTEGLERRRDSAVNEPPWLKRLDSLSECICFVDQKLRIVRANAAFQAFVDRDARTLLGSSYLQVLQDSVGVRDLDFWQARDPRVFGRAEMRVGGSSLVFVSEPVFSEERQLIGTIQRLADVTRTHAAETGLKHGRETLEVALRAGELASRQWSVDDGTLSWAGDAAGLYRLPGPTALPASHAAWIERIHPEDRDRVAAAIRTATLQGGTYETEFRVAGQTGDAFWLREKGQVLTGEGAQAAHLVAVDGDITESRRAADELRRAKVQAEAASLAKSQFLANMNHEIRTPLGAILGFAELLGEPEESETDRSEYRRQIQRNGELLLRIIDDVLDLSKVESGLMAVEHQPTGLLEFVDDLSSSLQEQALGKGLKLSFFTEGSLPAKVLTDPIRLKQILINIVGNAIKFTAKGGVTVTFRVAFQGQDRGDVKLIAEVRDTGVGIDQVGLERLFQPFAQADTSLTRRYGGTGLGLALARRLARLMGGDVSLLSTDTGGSTFRITVACEVPREGVVFERLDAPEAIRASSNP